MIRIHVEHHPPTEPKGPHRPHGSARGTAVSEGHPSGQETTVRNVSDSVDSQLGRLMDRLKGTAEVRQDVVLAARNKLAQGAFSTREAAERLAASELRHEFFSHHP